MKKIVLIMIGILFFSMFQCAHLAYAAPEQSALEEFRFVSVGLSVEDINGTPVEGAEVLAFSEDWGIRSPGTRDKRTFWSTNSSGNVSMTIPMGKWSFFAVSGWNYAYLNRGGGFFLSSINLTVTADMSITLRPSTTITIRPRDILGNPIDVEARVMEMTHAPIVPTDIAGLSNSGTLVVQVSGGYSYDVLLAGRPDSVLDGYYMILNGIPAGSNNDVSFQESELARIMFEAHDLNNTPTEGNVEVRFPEFDINNMVVDFTFQESAVVYFTPSIVQFNYRFMTFGWYLYLTGNNFFNVTAGSDQTISFGGPFKEELQVIPWASNGTGGSPNFTPETQIWLKITDSYQHILNLMGDPSGNPQFQFALTQNGSTIFASSIPTQSTLATLAIRAEYQEDSSPNFTASGDLGPFGAFQINGTLISDETMYEILNITTVHFRAAVPQGFPDSTSRNLAYMDELYEIYEDMVGAPIEGQVQYEVDIVGGGFWWENLVIPAKVLLVVYINSDPFSPNTLFFESHEFGHSRTLRSPTVIPPDYFGESIPTLLAIEGISRIYGPKMWLWGMGSHDLFFYHLKGAPLTDRFDLIETSEFVLEYIEKTYGWNAHKRLINGWSGNLTNQVEILSQAGFNVIEILATLYSYVVRDNLGWLFDMAGLSVTEARVNQGLDLISKRVPVACFEWSPLLPTAGESITFDASPSLPGWNGTNTAPIILYSWDFGDGTQANGQTVTHTYASPGDFTITLNVTDTQGSWNMEQKQIQVANVIPEFPSILVLPLLVLLTFCVTIVFPRRRTNRGMLVPRISLRRI